MKTFLKAYKTRITLFLLIILIINMVVLRIFDAPLKNEISSKGIVSFELAKDIDKTIQILDSWDANAKINAGLSLGLDFLFLLVYSSFITILIYSVNNRLWKNKSVYKLGKLLIVLIFTAAIFDSIENIALIQLLLGDLKQTWSSIAYYFAFAKFTIVLICIFYLLVNGFLTIFSKK